MLAGKFASNVSVPAVSVPAGSMWQRCQCPSIFNVLACQRASNFNAPAVSLCQQFQVLAGSDALSFACSDNSGLLKCGDATTSAYQHRCNPFLCTCSNPGGGMCPLGYETAQLQNLLFKGAPMKMDDERLNKTHDNHVFIARKVEEGRVPPSMAGCSGLSSIVKYLDYVDAMNIFVVPAAHCLLFGVAAGFWAAMLIKVTSY